VAAAAARSRINYKTFTTVSAIFFQLADKYWATDSETTKSVYDPKVVEDVYHEEVVRHK